MNMDRNSVLAIVCCVVFFIAYQAYMNEKYPHLNQPKQTEATQSTTTSSGGDESSSSSRISQQNPKEAGDQSSADHPSEQKATATISDQDSDIYPPLSKDELTFETKDFIIEFDQEFSAIKRMVMKRYTADSDPDSKAMQLLDSPLKIQGMVSTKDLQGQHGYQGIRQGNTLTLSKKVNDWQVEERFTIPVDTYSMKVDLTFTNLATNSRELTSGLLLQQNYAMGEEKSSFGPAAFVMQRKNIIVGIDGDRDYEDLDGSCKDDDVVSIDTFRLAKEKIDFLGVDLHYFLTVFKPESTKLSTFVEKVENRTDRHVCQLAFGMFDTMGYIQPGQSVTMSYKGYLGPKDIDILASHDPSFDQTMNFKTLGLNLSVLAKPLLSLIQVFYSVVPNYGVAIILLTLILKILFYPLTKSAAISMKKMQKLQPEMAKIREKYKNDPQKQQQTLMAFMSKNKANPMKGCLPILPQMPVFFAFYSVLSQAIELRHAAFFGWIYDLSIADPYYILPLLLGGLMFAQQKLTPNPGMDPAQQKVMMMMPIIFTFMMLALPAGLVLYMIVNTIVSIGQQQWLNKKFEHMEFKVVPA